jgi:hypothetical protein
MLDGLINVAKNAAAYLQSGVAPPNATLEQTKELADTNHLASKKFFLAFSGFIILGVFFAVSTAILWLMADKAAAMTAYTVVFSKTMEVFATIMAVYLGGQALVDLRYNSSSSASMQGNVQQVDITQKIIATEKEEDYTLEVEQHEYR